MGLRIGTQTLLACYVLTQALVQIFMCCGFFVNAIVCLQIMQNAVVTINAVTGVNIYASSFVLPLGVAAYAMIGGLKVINITITGQLLVFKKLSKLHVLLTCHY